MSNTAPSHGLIFFNPKNPAKKPPSSYCNTLVVCLFVCFVVTDVHGRTFGVWTLLTCTLCFLCAFNLENKPLYLATFLSFIYALGHFLTEYLIYHTMAVSNLSTVAFFAGNFLLLICFFLSGRDLGVLFCFVTLQIMKIWSTHMPLRNRVNVSGR